MAKRARGTTRPGQRAPLQRGPARPAGAAAVPGAAAAAIPRPATLTAAEEARAAELEAQIVAEERAAEQVQRRTRDRARRPADSGAPAASGSLSVRAAEEYSYVVRDVRRIAVIGGGLVALLIGFWVVVEATGIGPF